MIDSLITTFLSLDQNLSVVVNDYGVWAYFILFGIIFFETGFIIFPFLPGDTLLFMCGAAAAGGIVDLNWALAAIIAGAILGDTANYWIGNYLGIRVFMERFPTLVKKEHIDRTYSFFEKYGGATIFIARFIPVVRTFSPFLAGIGSMNYSRFLMYNVLGGVTWASLFVLGGYYFGKIPVVMENMSLLIILVILVTAVTVFAIIAGVISEHLNRQTPPRKTNQ